MEQQEELAGAEPGEGEVAGAPPDPAPIMEILPLADVPAEEEDTQAPMVDVDDPPAADPPAGLHLNPELVRGLAEGHFKCCCWEENFWTAGGYCSHCCPTTLFVPWPCPLPQAVPQGLGKTLCP